jgi:hypothetical protein
MSIFVILALICIAVLVAFLVMKLKGSNTNGVIVVGEPIKLYNMTQQAILDQSNLPPTINGQQYSFSFWLYLIDFVPTGDGPQMVFMRSNANNSVASASAIAAFDGKTNRLNFAIRTNLSTGDFDPNEDFVTDNGRNYIVASIDYFPMQRWVHVVGIVNDNMFSIYMNNTLYTVANVSDKATDSEGRPVFAASLGSIVVGSNGVPSMRESRSFITQFKFYNFGVTPGQVSAVYSSGPSSSSFFAKIGLSGYGLRSPIYKMDA